MEVLYEYKKIQVTNVYVCMYVYIYDMAINKITLQTWNVVLLIFQVKCAYWIVLSFLITLNVSILLKMCNIFLLPTSVHTLFNFMCMCVCVCVCGGKKSTFVV